MIRTLLARFSSPLLAVALFGVALGWYKASLREAEERGKTAVALAQRDTARARLDSVVITIRMVRDSADSVASLRLAKAAQDAQRASQVHAGRIKALQTVNDSLLARGTATDSLAALAWLIQVTAELRGAESACRSGWAATDTTLTLCRERQARADSTIREGANLLRETERLLAVQVKRSKPGVFTQVRRALPLMAATAVLTLLLTGLR